MVVSVVILGAVLAVTPQVRILDARAVQALLPAAAVVDARPADAFRQAHVPGAQSMPWEAFTRETPGLGHLVSGSPQHWGQLAPPRDVEPRLRAMGLSNTRTVVVVGDPQGWGDEGRAAWSLLYWGATDVVLLDGGLPAWVGAGFPTEKGGAATPRRGTFTVRPVEQRRAGMQQVWEVVRGQPGALLDVRSAQEFAGSVMPGQTRGGHIPRARLVEHRGLYTAEGRYVDAATLRALVGETGSEAPITYCTGGVRSALLAVLLEARLGVLAANYDGSMWEWSAQRDTPVVRAD